MNNRIIIIPAYNEEDNIAPIIESAKRHSDAKIVVIDDGSEDLTAVKTVEAGAFVISHPFGSVVKNAGNS